MASIENMTDEEILASQMPGQRGYVMPSLRDPSLQKRTNMVEDDIDLDEILSKSMDAEPVYEVGEPDIEDGFVDRVVRGAERVGRGAKGVATGLGDLAYGAFAAKQKAIMDPAGAAEEAKQFASKVLEGDPEAQEQALIATSMSMVEPAATGADVELARRDIRKAIETRDPGDIATAGISTVFAAIPIVGVGLTKGITKAAPDAPEPVFESVLEKAAVDKIQKKTGVDAIIPTLRSGGATKSEIADTKVAEFVEQAKAEGKKSITKDEVIKHLDDNKVQIDEVRLSNKPQGMPEEVVEQLDQLNLKAMQDYNDLYEDGKAVARILAPGEDVTDQMHRFSDNSTHFNSLYVNYVGAIDRIERFENVPPDVEDVVNGVIDLNKNVPVSDWTPEDAARITNARNVINAKRADREYMEFTLRRGNEMRSRRRRTEEEHDSIMNDVAQSENLSTIARILNNMPEAETRLVALRQFEALPKYQEYIRSQKEYKDARAAFEVGRKDLSPRWENYTAPAGDNYQEILLTVPKKKLTDLPEGFEVLDMADVYKKTQRRGRYYQVFHEGSPVGGSRGVFGTPEEAKRFAINEINQSDAHMLYGMTGYKNFHDSHHSDIPNVLVHIRTKDRFDHKGRKILFVEEIQSDWHQMGRSRGYINERQLLKLKDQITDFTEKWVAKKQNTDKIQQSNPSINKFVYGNRTWTENTSVNGDFSKIENLDEYQSLNDSEKIKLKELFDLRIDEAREYQKIEKMQRQSVKLSTTTIPDAPLKDTKEWTALAIRRIFREAADGGYDGVAFSRADMITPVVTLPRDEAMDLIGEPEAFLQRLENLKQRGGQLAEGAEQAEKVFKGNQYYYDKLLPSIAKKESKGDAATTLIELKDVGFSKVKERQTPGMSYPMFDQQVETLVDRGEVIEVPFFELTKEVKNKVSKPQKLYEAVIGAGAGGAAARSMREDEVADDQEG